MSTTSRRWAAGVVAVAAVAVVVAACDPIPHPNVTQVASAASGLRVLMVSGDGDYAVVTSTGQGAITPGAGLWRVRRSDHASVSIPSSSASAISRDGSRIRTIDGLWVDGSMRTFPTGVVTSSMSPDLDAYAYTDNAGAVKLWNTSADTTTTVDPGSPPPNAFGAPQVAGVSNGGGVVYLLWGITDNSVVREFVDVSTGTSSSIRPNTENTVFGPLSADGTAISKFDFTNGTASIITTEGVEGKPFPFPSGYQFESDNISADGSVLWVSIAARGTSTTLQCGTDPRTGQPIPCPIFTDRRAVAITMNGSRSMTMQAGQITTADIGARATPDGRLLMMAFDFFTNGPSTGTQVADWYTGNVETLPEIDPGPSFYTGTGITDGGQLIVAQPGWTEFAANP
jgi:hypothetical protein